VSRHAEDNDLSNTNDWTTVNTSDIDIGSGYSSAAFDGRYLYLAPGGNGIVPRYDTQSALSAATSWSSFDVKTVSSTAAGFRGAVFDGHYVYFVPYSHPDGTIGGTVVRYDTKLPYNSAGSWSSFDVSSLDANATGFVGGQFDGRYLYLVPYGQDTALSGTLARFDTQGSFSDAAAWSTFDTRTINPSSEGFYGATFDGRYLYLSPYADGWGSYNSTMTRYDTKGNLSDPASWKVFDTATIDGRAKGYFGATFDGRYAYFVPYSGDGSPGGMLARFDTHGDFRSASSWSFFDTTTLGVAPQGALFDGKYVYLVPSASPTGPSGRVARLDTTQPLSAAAWSTFDVSASNPDAVWFFGGAFDGRYIYLLPSLGKSIARFEARNPAQMPSSYFGSFF
jgi:hypothetical protein